MKKILVVDDHTMFRQAVIAIIMERMSDGSMVCDNANSADTARNKLAEHSYDLIILDISMPGTSGMALLPEVRALYPQTPVLMLSMYPEEQFALQALRLGASGYMTKQEAAEELIAAIQCILSGGSYVSRSFSRQLVDHVLQRNTVPELRHSRLSRRELEVLKQLVTGKTLKRIGDDMGLSIKTISTYKTRLKAKMGIRNSADMVRYAMLQGQI